MIFGDVNEDQLTDILLSDDSHSRIDLLIQEEESQSCVGDRGSGQSQCDSQGGKVQQRRIPVDKAVASLGSGDLNHDGKLDLAYIGAGPVVLPFPGKSGTWSEPKKYPDLQPAAWILGVGDVNHDGKDAAWWCWDGGKLLCSCSRIPGKFRYRGNC